MENKLQLMGRLWTFMWLVLLLSDCGHPIAVPLWRAKKLLTESSYTDGTVDRSRRSESDDSSSDSRSSVDVPVCRDPGIPENGRRFGGSLRVGSELFFTCNTGYLLEGSEVLTCRYGEEDEVTWDADPPLCVAQNRTDTGPDPCGTPPEPSTHAYRATYQIGISVTYRCVDGYKKVSGSEQMNCLDEEWEGEPLQCRRIRECRDYESIRNGERIIEGTREGSIVIFRCNEDYSLLGSQQVVCGSDGYWSDHWPVCRKSPVNCGDPGLPENGHRVVEGTTESSEVEYFCVRGYALIGPMTRTCTSTGEWSGRLPVCQRVDCGPPESPAQGKAEYTSTEYGTEARYSCNAGYVRSGASSCVCSSDGSWSLPPPTCTMVHCSALSSPVNGAIDMTAPVDMYSSMAIYSCQQGFGLVGSPTRTCQADGTWSGSTPQCQSGRCSTLEDPVNGRVVINHLFPGGKARYSCNSGYFLSGRLQRTCGYQGLWSGQAPVCKPIKCASLKAPRHGSVELTDDDNFNSVATYDCDEGYELFGDEARFCQASGIWTGRPPGCYEVDCGPLSAPHDGSVTFNSTKLWSEASYSCDPGFVLRFGDEIRTCIRRGRWSGKPPCCLPEDVMCPVLPPPDNGQVMFTTNVGDTATYTCNDGYELSGEGTRLCLPGGVWNGSAPSCELEQFETPMCPNLTDPVNGTVEVDPTNNVATYSCEEGFELVGPVVRNCQRDGNWSGIDPSCVLVDCGGLEPPDNGTIELREGTLFGSIAVYDCDDGFEIVGSIVRVCLETGQWSDEAPICEIIDCGTLSAPLNGEIDIDSTTEGSVALYRCNAGYTINGPEERTCQCNGTWTGVDPVCELIDCGDLEPPDNGDVDLSGTGLGSLANYSCDPLHSLVGSETRTCMENGEWMPGAPVCEPFQCPELFNITNGAVSVASRIPGSIATYTCDFGFELQGDSQRECLENETWTGEDPSCFQITCPSLDNPVNGIVDIQGNTPGGSAIYRCNPGLSLIGSSRRTCTVDGTWSGVPPTCEELLCPVLASPENGEVFVTGQTVNSIATYFCNDGFIPELLIRSCLDNGEWSGFDPLCIRNECDPDELRDPANGMVMFDSITLGSVATYTCDRAYRLIGTAMRTCVRNGANTVWNGREPFCQLIICPPLSLVNGVVFMTSDTVGSQAIHSCNEGFTLVGDTLRECLTSGLWSKDPPTCAPDPGTIACPSLDAPPNGNIDITVTTPGATVSYSCNPGHILDGSATRRCLANGVWTGSDPVCNPVDCGRLLAPSNGRVTMQPTPDSTTLNSIGTYFCNQGFMLVGTAVRVCLQDGQWSGNEPSCDPVDCGALASPVNGIVDTSDGTTFGSTATYGCILNFVISGESMRVCMADGVWGGEAPTCVTVIGNPDMDCGDPGTPTDGSRTINSTIVGSVVMYSCNEGFMLEGDENRVCQSNQEWSGELPNCIPVMCPILPDPDNATIFVTGQGVGSQATYICSSGFVVRPGDVIIRNCLPTGEWSGSEPRCIPASTFMCPSLDDPANGAVALTGRSPGSIATFTCNFGYRLSGSPILRCGERGIWNDTEPTCERIRCPDPGTPSNGRRIGEDFRAGMLVFFFCDDGHMISGEPLLQCLDNGTWSQDTPTCVLIDVSTSLMGTVMDQFGRICDAVNGRLENCCRYRQDWATLNDQEKSRYIKAVKTVSSDPSYSQLYNELVSRYRQSFTTDIQLLNASLSQFIPWHRYFLLEYESLLRLVDSDITIPYWDWTVRPSTPYTEEVFDPTPLGFGNSVNETTMCVSSGAFREGDFEVTPSAGGGCLMRQYLDTILLPTRALIEDQFLSLSAEKFDDFHNAVFQFVNLIVRCTVGGDMCSVDAANDPLYLLQLARVDLVVDRWQNMDEARASVRYTNDATPLQLTFDKKLLVSDFSANKELPYGVCVCYGDLRDVEETTTDSGSVTGFPGLGTGSLQVESPPKRPKRGLHLNCISEEEIDKFRLSDKERESLRKTCGYSAG